MGSKKVVFNRDKLYEQVWEQPMIALPRSTACWTCGCARSAGT